MKTWKQKLVVGLAVLVAIGILAFQLLTSFGYVREMPPYLGETSYYSFDPETILTDLETEDRNLFLPLAEETFLAAQWSPNTIKLPYDGYSKILNAFYKFLWNEPLAKWDLDNIDLNDVSFLIQFENISADTQTLQITWS